MKREYVLFLAGTLVVALIAVAITIVATLPARPVEEVHAPLEPSAYGPEDFLIPQPKVSDPEFIPSRPRLQSWSDEMVDQFWIDPTLMAEKFLREQADQEVGEILKRLGR